MRQAIVTKYLGPTNHRGSRVKAIAQAGTITVAWDDAADVDANHETAARMLAQRYGWLKGGYALAGGALPDGTGNCYVLVRAED